MYYVWKTSIAYMWQVPASCWIPDLILNLRVNKIIYVNILPGLYVCILKMFSSLIYKENITSFRIYAIQSIIEECNKFKQLWFQNYSFLYTKIRCQIYFHTFLASFRCNYILYAIFTITKRGIRNDVRWIHNNNFEWRQTGFSVIYTSAIMTAVIEIGHCVHFAHA